MYRSNVALAMAIVSIAKPRLPRALSPPRDRKSAVQQCILYVAKSSCHQNLDFGTVYLHSRPGTRDYRCRMSRELVIASLRL